MFNADTLGVYTIYLITLLRLVKRYLHHIFSNPARAAPRTHRNVNIKAHRRRLHYPQLNGCVMDSLQ